MALDNGPPDGDYVAYIAHLVNRGQAAPGEALSASDHKRLKRLTRGVQTTDDDLPASVWGHRPSATAEPLPGQRWRVQPNPPTEFHEGLLQAARTPGTANPPPADTATPKARRAVFTGLFQILLGVFVLIAFGAALIDMFAEEDFALPQLIPVVVVLLITFQLFRHGIGTLRGKTKPSRRDRTSQADR